MLKIYVRIGKVDMDGYNGREHHPTRALEGCFVRVTNMDTVPPEMEAEEAEFDNDGRRIVGPDHDTRHQEGWVDEGYQVFTGILVDANGDDIEGGEVELVEHELESKDGILTTFSKALLS